MGRCGDFNPALRPANRARQRRNRLLLRDHALVQLFFHAQQLLRLFFLDAGYRHARPAAHHVLNVLAAHNAGRRIVEVVLVAQGAQVLALLALLVGVEPRLLKFVIRNRRIHAVHDELDPLLHLGDLFGQRGLAQLHARAGFVDQIDRLVGQKAIGNIAARVRHGKLHRGIGIAHRMKLLIAVLDAHDDLDRLGLVRRRHLHRLEAPFQRAILLDRLAVLRRSRRADALNLAARQAPASECSPHRAIPPPIPRPPACAARR